MNKIFKSKAGATVVEFAMVLPVLILLVFGIIEFSLILYDKAMITNASREGARAGIVYRADPATGAYSPLTYEKITDVVNEYLSNHLITFGESTNANVTVPTICTGSGAELTVNVEFSYNFLLLPDFIEKIFGKSLVNPIPLNVTTVMRCE